MTKPRFTARTPVDLIALAPVVLGFHPEDSIVLLTFGATSDRQFHARVDLPVGDDLDEVVALLTGPVRRHAIEVGAVLIYTEDEELADTTASVLAPALEQAGCRLVDVLSVEDAGYRRLLDPGATLQPFDISSHAFTAQAVLLGRQTMPNRAGVADQLVGGSAEDIEAVRAAAMDAEQSRCADAVERRWIQRLLGHWLESRETPTAQDAGRLLALVTEIELRDVAWAQISRGSSEAFKEFWIGLLRRCPNEFLPAPAGLLAFTAWLTGDGALAWCAVDRCLESDPDYSLGHLIGTMLRNAVPPSEWTDPVSA